MTHNAITTHHTATLAPHPPTRPSRRRIHLRRLTALAVCIVFLTTVATGAILASRALAPLQDDLLQRVSASWDAAQAAWSRPE